MKMLVFFLPKRQNASPGQNGLQCIHGQYVDGIMMQYATYMHVTFSRLSLNRTSKILFGFLILFQMADKCRKTALRTAHTGAVCRTVDLYLAVIRVKSLQSHASFVRFERAFCLCMS